MLTKEKYEFYLRNNIKIAVCIAVIPTIIFGYLIDWDSTFTKIYGLMCLVIAIIYYIAIANIYPKKLQILEQQEKREKQNKERRAQWEFEIKKIEDELTARLGDVSWEMRLNGKLVRIYETSKVVRIGSKEFGFDKINRCYIDTEIKEGEQKVVQGSRAPTIGEVLDGASMYKRVHYDAVVKSPDTYSYTVNLLLYDLKQPMISFYTTDLNQANELLAAFEAIAHKS